MPYVGADFPDTTPVQQRVYTLDFVNMIAILFVDLVTVGGAPTPGDTIILTLTNPTLAKLSETVSYTVQPNDTLASIAAALAAVINGDDVLNDVNITASAAGPAFSLQWPGSTNTISGPIQTVIVPSLIPAASGGAPTETISVTPATPAGETILSAVASTTVWQGTPDPVSRIIQQPYVVNGSKVAVVAGGFLPNRYRLQIVATTSQQPAVELYSHITCNLEQ